VFSNAASTHIVHFRPLVVGCAPILSTRSRNKTPVSASISFNSSTHILFEHPPLTALLSLNEGRLQFESNKLDCGAGQEFAPLALLVLARGSADESFKTFLVEPPILPRHWLQICAWADRQAWECRDRARTVASPSSSAASSSHLRSFPSSSVTYSPFRAHQETLPHGPSSP